MAESHYQRFSRKAFEVLGEWLDLLRPEGHTPGRGSEKGHPSIDLERVVKTGILLGEAAQKQPRNSSEAAQKQLAPSLLGETFKEGGLPKKASRSRSSSSSSNLRSEDFGPKFWDLWPVGKKAAKTKCQSRWKALTDEQADLVFQDLSTKKRATRDPKWVDGFIPNPLTYLNQERWTDDWDEKIANDEAEQERVRRIIYGEDDGR